MALAWDTLKEVAASSLLKLLALEFWWSLLEESANTFAAIFGRETFYLLLDFLLQRFGEFFLLAREQHALHRANGNPRTARNFLRQRPRFALQLRRQHHPIHNAQPQRFGGVDHVAGVKHFSRFRRAHQFGQEKRPAVIRKQSDLGKILAERRIFRGDPNIRSQGNV